MADIATISAFITSVKNAVEIAKTLKDADYSLEKAEAKLKMADLIVALAESRTQASETQELIQEKDNRIAELEKALELKAKPTRVGEAYYETNDGGEPFGAPYCNHCWEVNHVAVHLHRGALKPHWHCPKCSTEYAKYYIKILGSTSDQEGAT